MQTKESPDEDSEEALSNGRGGTLIDRFAGNRIVVHAQSKPKSTGRELQLPSMSLLTNKNSSQQFLLRILKVIIQLREAARVAAKKARVIGKYQKSRCLAGGIVMWSIWMISHSVISTRVVYFLLSVGIFLLPKGRLHHL